MLALVDVNLLLETIERENLEIGAWVNVIGYVGGVSRGEEAGLLGRNQSSKLKHVDADTGGKTVKVEVQAVMVWSAGAVKTSDYERAIERRLQSA